MQKKLYFLNEEEKNRILNLHESRTKRQYLVEQESKTSYGKPELGTSNLGTKLDLSFKSVDDINKSGLLTPRQKDVETIRLKCNQNLYGGSVNNDAIKRQLPFFKKNFIGRSFWFTDAGLEDVQYELKKLGNMPSFCGLNKEFSNLTSGEDLLSKMNKGVYTNAAFDKYIISTLKDLEKNPTVTDTKIETDPETGTQNDTLMGDVVKKHKEKLATQSKKKDYGMGVVQPKLKGNVKELLAKAGIQGEELNQSTINQLYKFLEGK